MMFLDHVAVLTTEIERFCAVNQLSSAEPIEVFSDSGSREQYMDVDDVGGRLLLMQPHGDGPYQRALAKRGPGLHHLGIAVVEMMAALEEWRGRGWEVHPGSAGVISPERGAFLFQRGVPTLIELFVGASVSSRLMTEVSVVAEQEVFPAVVGVGPGSETTVLYSGRRLRMI